MDNLLWTVTSNLYEVQNAATLVKLDEKKEGRKITSTTREFGNFTP